MGMKNLRTLAMYLPQFHAIAENSKWWGDGYTEWTAVRLANPLFEGHEQPRVPDKERYYNLLDRSTMEWQAETAKKYGIDGFCFYHYWFCRDRKILEKPAENLLAWKDVDMPFCFSWDSDTWARTWTKVGNSWADAFELNARKEERDDGILLEQNYGNESYWRAHFVYLLPFFRDARYIKVDGKPVFVFYSSMKMPPFVRMVAAWRRWALEEGLPGLYVIAYHVPDPSADAVILPMAFAKSTLGYHEMGETIGGTSLRGYNYDAVWQDYLSYMPSQTNRTLWLGIARLDDTPRRGANGRLFMGESPAKFERYFAQLVEKSRRAGNPFVFINAWNEWGEGMYLEPDTIHKNGYLEAVKHAVIDRKEQEGTEEIRDRGWKRQAAMLEAQYLSRAMDYRLMTSWLRLMMDCTKLANYLRSMNVCHLAIYACSIHGKLLHNSLQKTGVAMDYFVDVRKEGLARVERVPVFSPEECLPKTDLMVIALTGEFESVYVELHKKVDCPVISIYELVYGAEKYHG